MKSLRSPWFKSLPPYGGYSNRRLWGATYTRCEAHTDMLEDDVNLTPRQQKKIDVEYYLEMVQRAVQLGRTATAVYWQKVAHEIARVEGFVITAQGNVLDRRSE